jgi:MFS transporter, PAT family, beta-lactamase induction signal transducer AmpG
MRRRTPVPWLFSILNVPHAVVTAGVSGTLLSYLLRQQGVAPHNIANENSLLLLPGSLFFVWSPVTDFLWKRRTWLLVSSAAAGVAVMLALQTKSYASKGAVALLLTAGCLILLASAATGGLVASLMRAEERTRVGCFLQAGNLGGGALAGGGLLLLASHVNKLTLGVAAGAVVLAPALLALLLDEPPVAKRGRKFSTEMLLMGREFKKTFLRLSALPAVLLLMSPLGSGGAVGILSSIAKDYGVSANQVAWTNGLTGAVLTTAGAISMALMPARFDIRMAYAVTGLVNAGVLGVFCFGTPRPWMYLVGTGLFLFTVGACWAMYSALVLKIVGAPGRSGCGRYAMGVSIANLPVAYMAVLDGWGAKWFGPKGLPGIDMAVSGVAAVAFLGWFWWERVKGLETEIGLVEEFANGGEALNA